MAEVAAVKATMFASRCTSKPTSISYFNRGKPLPGNGYLAGSFPGGITKVEGVPSPATIRVLYRNPGGEVDSYVMAEVVSGADGSWRVDGLDATLRFDVVCRVPGYADMIVSDVTPKVD